MMTETIQQGFDVKVIQQCLKMVINILQEELDTHKLYGSFFDKYQDSKVVYDCFGDQLRALLDKFTKISSEVDTGQIVIVKDMQACSEEMSNLLASLHNFYTIMSIEVDAKINKNL